MTICKFNILSEILFLRKVMDNLNFLFYLITLKKPPYNFCYGTLTSNELLDKFCFLCKTFYIFTLIKWRKRQRFFVAQNLFVFKITQVGWYWCPDPPALLTKVRNIFVCYQVVLRIFNFVIVLAYFKYKICNR